MRRAKSNTHTDAGGNVYTCGPIRVTNRNGWHKISGASACRCQSCWPRPMYRTQSWFLRLDDFAIKALHIVGEGGRERSLDYISSLK